MTEPDDTPESVDPEIAAALAELPPDFSSFASVFERDIRPALQARETDRIAAAQMAIRGRWIGVGVGLFGAALSLLAFRVPQLVILAGIVGFGIAGFMGRALRGIGREAKTLMVEPVAREFGLSFIEAPGDQPSIYDLRDARLLPSWDRINFEDRLSGKRGKVDFEFFEAHLEQRRRTTDSRGRTRTKWVTVFRGQCLRFDFHKAFHGRTLVARDAGIFNRFIGGGDRDMKRARLEDPRFEKAFEVYTTDQVESRFLLTPDVMQTLVELEETFHGGKLRCAFVNGEIMVAVEGGDLFEPGSLFTPLDNPERIRELLNDFAAVFHLIDAVSKGQSRRDDV